MVPFILRAFVETPFILGRWLTLDAILDGVLEAAEVPAADRVLPLASWDGSALLEPMTAIAARDSGAVFCGSATIVGGSMVRLAPDVSDREYARAEIAQPGISPLTFRSGFNPALDFPDGGVPWKARGVPNVQTRRGSGGSVLRTVRTVGPGPVEWLATGDPEAVAAILSDAMGIGSKVRNGFGKLAPGSVGVESLPGSPDLLGIVSEDGSDLMRPVPLSLFGPGAFPDSRARAETVRPPYWDRAGVVAALVPVTVNDALLMR